MKSGQKVGWGIVIFLAFLTSGAAILRVGAIETGVDVRRPPEMDRSFDDRYAQNPLTTYVHILPGVVFMFLGPLQFSKSIRVRALNFHRWSGRVFLLASLAAATFGMALAIRLPAFGGLNTAVAAYFFGTLFLFCIVKAYVHVRRRQIILHREWMIRAFAIGLGVSTIRLMVAVFLLMHYRMQDIFGISFWLGFSINMIAAEVWITQTRVRAHAIA